MFPSLGLLKSYSSKERDQKFRLYTEEIERINKKIENSEYSDENYNSDNFKSQAEGNERQIEKHIENFKEEVTKLKEIATNIEKNKVIDESKNKFKFKSDFGIQLSDCNSKTTSVLQVSTYNTNIIRLFSILLFAVFSKLEFNATPHYQGNPRTEILRRK